jgi:diguanylate cyclase (GGDEF)-like protein
MIDIDCFKKFNDQYGHAAGDSALVRVAGVLQQSMKRPNDYVFRLGGEEFGLLFSDTNIKKTKVFLEEIRTKIEGLNIQHVACDVSEFVTISAGAIIDTENTLEKSDLYNKADELLYKAKSDRNKIVVN